ncbi:DpnII family type II restriction endonuclease [Clostridium perfringens]|uniref:Type-2 restriction enzyme n=2 Tax=Clostridium perfringens TaxID=1502 RepID=A0A140GR59_CLOPF|nr:DpnII family type II restriction endonuclease [Clostridium perfringens]AMN31018.1 Type II restriction enzyme MjaIII [Clostridium perfringens]
MNIKLNDFINNIDTLNINWNYFVDFSKINNIEQYQEEIVELNKLLKESEKTIDNKLLSIIKNKNSIINVLILALALRPDKLKNLKIYSPYSNENIYNLIKKTNENEILYMFHQSGLRDLFLKDKITNLNDYLMGIEVGLDSNCRKNRSGYLMESYCENKLNSICSKNNFKLYRQCTLNKIIPSIKLNKKFDFIVKTPLKIFAIEVNNFNSSGSKIKSISNEYILLSKHLESMNINFIWITNGKGWLKNKSILENNLESLKNFITLNDLNDNIFLN